MIEWLKKQFLPIPWLALGVIVALSVSICNANNLAMVSENHRMNIEVSRRVVDLLERAEFACKKDVTGETDGPGGVPEPDPTTGETAGSGG